MKGTKRMAGWGLVPLLIAGLQACGSDTAVPQQGADAVQCVEIPDGYYLFANGKFTPTTEDMAIEVPAEVSQKDVVWINQFEDLLRQTGPEWVRLKAVNEVLFVSGEAESEDARQEALKAVRAAIVADRQLLQRNLYMVDAVSTPDEPRPPGALFMSMPHDPPLEACRTRGDQLARSQQITYDEEDRVVSEDSHGLLDALAGLAMICRDYRLEIGVHTDARGAESYNRVRSQSRADAIAAYLEQQGIQTSQLVPFGYGETRPIDPAQTSEAYALNRRVEFHFLDKGE